MVQDDPHAAVTKKKDPNAFSSKKRWDERELRALRILVEDQMPLEQIVERMNEKFETNRTKSSVRQAIVKRGKDWNYQWVPTVRKWAPEEFAIIATYYRQYGAKAVVAVLDYAGYKRTLVAVTSRIYREQRRDNMKTLLTYKQGPRPKRPIQKLLLARNLLQKALKAQRIVDIEEELHTFTGIELSTLGIAAKQLVKDGIAVELGANLYARPIKEARHDRRP